MCLYLYLSVFLYLSICFVYMSAAISVFISIDTLSSTFRQRDDVIKWKNFPRNWPFVQGIHWSPVNYPHKGQWSGALMLSLICARINGWVNNGEAGDLRRYRAHYDVIAMKKSPLSTPLEYQTRHVHIQQLHVDPTLLSAFCLRHWTVCIGVLFPITIIRKCNW